MACVNEILEQLGTCTLNKYVTCMGNACSDYMSVCNSCKWWGVDQWGEFGCMCPPGGICPAE